MEIPVIFEDAAVLIVEKPAGIPVFSEGNITEKTVIDYLIEQNPALTKAGEAPRYGVVHRLDKGTSGLLAVAKTSEALIFFQKQFKNRDIRKKYLALATGTIPNDVGTIEAAIGRSPKDPRKQKAYLPGELLKPDAREAVTAYTVLQRFTSYTLLEVEIKTGRKHQIRCHLAHIHHPLAGDALYGFKDSPQLPGLTRQFLHASYMKLTMPDGQMKEFHSNLPTDLKIILKGLGARV